MKISVLTLTHNRNGALFNTLAGLAAGTELPAEVVIVHLNEDTIPLPELPFPVKSLTLHTGNHLNLARARNTAMAQSSSAFNIFLDVDCVPARDLIAEYRRAFQSADVLWSGTVRYLAEGATDIENWQHNMESLSRPDPVRHGHDTYPYEWFWSLNFGCSAAVFDKIGRFDEQFKGYGGEDTDFAFSARANGVPLKVVHATAYHQHHPSYSPPLNHFTPIISNASRFIQKWKQLPMPGWLEAFARMDLIRINGNEIEILRNPAEAEIQAALK
ncbi:glycosyltransferase family 2 protein [Pedobacter sp. SYP-B3415]|uniref:glycosyltransferase family 2 protein n=1 Tax=Pedobacter sp. SYP-B3415 TaxID=2496641 RepID=UPI0013EB062E|nr:glycosyltransferase [Pedobacter sp. SYP-B3415]